MTQFEKTVYFMKKPWVIFLYAIFVIIAYHFVDRSLAAYFHQLDLGTKVPVLEIFTALGKSIAYIILFFIAGLYFRYIRINPINEARSWYLLGCVFIANLVCVILKVTLSRARPELLFSSHEFGFYWFKLSSNYWSFPSGHTTTVISLATGLGVLFPRYFYGLLSLAFLIALSRILLCFHYLSDVMSAFYISVLVVSFFTEYLRRKVGSKKWVVLFGVKPQSEF
ncbi:PAP2 family protein [Legionella gratiana]|uniref:undecaprenyl-diphosphate phosphatase n=1 Tax=Legionella gratiana TaxID=45066 RepID=A0A378J6H7_9GAMM|nr:phosphatase PAP2 family protein [Legionella gratiana]KTD06160.1 PAP2 family protein [Legionella gratiana]STX42986.1 phosphoesterase, PA-phosphatase related [Legionella gratiana]